MYLQVLLFYFQEWQVPEGLWEASGNQTPLARRFGTPVSDLKGQQSDATGTYSLSAWEWSD